MNLKMEHHNVDEHVLQPIQPITTTYEHDGLKISLTVDEHTITDILEGVEGVIKAAGYCFDGRLDIINDEEELNEASFPLENR